MIISVIWETNRGIADKKYPIDVSKLDIKYPIYERALLDQSLNRHTDQHIRRLGLVFCESLSNQRVLVIVHGICADFPDLMKKDLIPSIPESVDSSEERLKSEAALIP